jgi:hypothetical protein
LYDYPLDHEIDFEGDYYRDPDIPDGQPTPQYTSVDVKYKFKHAEVEYKILEELYIPDEKKHKDKNQPSGRTEEDDYLINELVKESFRLTGNLAEEAKE